MSKGLPFWTNAVSSVTFDASGEKVDTATASGSSSSFHLSDIFACDVTSEEERWQDVMLANYMIDFRWLLQAAPQLLAVRGQIVVLSGERGTATVRVAGTGTTYARLDVRRESHNPIMAAARAAGLAHHPEGERDKVVVLEPPLPIPYGTHHTKMCLAVNRLGLRVAVFTANFIHADWHHKAQGIFVEDFPRRGAGAPVPSDRGNAFSQVLQRYLRHCGLARVASPSTASAAEASVLQSLGCFGKADFLDAFDFSLAKVALVASVPGSHAGSSANEFGMNRLAALTRRVPPPPPDAGAGPLQLTWQYSSQGSLNDRFLAALQDAMRVPGWRAGSVRVVYPTEEEVRQSVEGWRGGMSLPVRLKTCHEFVNARLHKWGKALVMAQSHGEHESPSATAVGRKRPRPPDDAFSERSSARWSSTAVPAMQEVIDVDGDEQEGDAIQPATASPTASGDTSPCSLWRFALPHLKTYAAVQEGHAGGGDQLQWFLLTSANLSQAAWGMPSGGAGKPTKLFIRSYELGVFYDAESSVDLAADGTPARSQWVSVTPSCPARFAARANSAHLYRASLRARGATDNEAADLFLPFDVLHPTPYASTQALRAAAESAAPAIGGRGGPRISRGDVPWVLDVPHSGSDSLGLSINSVAESTTFYGEASWFAPTRQRP